MLAETLAIVMHVRDAQTCREFRGGVSWELDSRDRSGCRLAESRSAGVSRSASQAAMRMVGSDEIEAAFPRWGRSCHMISSMDVTADGEQATASLFGVSYRAGAARPGGPMRGRGLRYQDRWKIERGGWALAERAHDALWQFKRIQIHTRLPDVEDRRAPLHTES
jgi:hypothetical protein